MKRSRHVALVLLTVITITGSGLAQMLPPSTPPTKPVDPIGAPAVREGLREFVASLDSPDTKSAKELFAGTPENFKLIETFHGGIHAAQRAKNAMTKKFPDEMAKRPAVGEISVASMLNRLENEPVTIINDIANVGQPIGGVSLRRIDGKWRVTDLVNDAGAKDRMNQLMPIIASVSDELAADIDAGKYKTLLDSEKAFALKVRIAAAGVLQAATSQPATPAPKP